MASKQPGALEKEKKVPLDKRFSLQSWMKLSADADLTGGVGKIDEDEDEKTWKVWKMAEVRKHNTREDMWMVIRGKVYNITQYLPYHPGGISILDKAAGNDGTVLFDKYHKWISAEAILEACFIGILAPKRGDDSEEEEEEEQEVVVDASDPAAGPSSSIPPSPPPSAAKRPSPRVVWDEATLAAHQAERGVEYGTMKIDQIDTPFLYYESQSRSDDATEHHSIHSNFLKSLAPEVLEGEGAQGAAASGPKQMAMEDLQKILGLLEVDEEGAAVLERPKYTAGGDADFEAKRQAIYAGEAQIAAASEGLPDGWAALLSRSEPREIFYYHSATKTTQWERPEVEVDPSSVLVEPEAC